MAGRPAEIIVLKYAKGVFTPGQDRFQFFGQGLHSILDHSANKATISNPAKANAATQLKTRPKWSKNKG